MQRGHSRHQKGIIRRMQSVRVRDYITESKSKGCEICGYNKCIAALDYHHVRGEKLFELSSVGSRSIEQVQAEIDKCILVCANCHRELHAENNGSLNNEDNARKPDEAQIVFNFFL